MRITSHMLNLSLILLTMVAGWAKADTYKDFSQELLSPLDRSDILIVGEQLRIPVKVGR